MVYDGDPEPQRRADAARAELDAILLAEVERSRAQPDNSITSAVANDPARGLSDEEIVAQLRVILFGAIETVESTLANAVLLLLSDPDALAVVRAEPGPHGQRDRGGHAPDPARRLHRALDGACPASSAASSSAPASSSASARSPPTATRRYSPLPRASTCGARTRATTSR